MDFKQYYNTIYFDIENKIPSFSIVQEDNQSRGIYIYFLNQINIDNLEMDMIYKQKNQKNILPAIKENNFFRFDFDSNFLSQASLVKGELNLKGDNGEIIKSLPFVIHIKERLIQNLQELLEGVF